MRGTGRDDEQLAVSPLRGVPAARVPVQERLVDRAAAEPVDGRRGRLAPAHVHRPQPAAVPQRDGDQVPVQAGVVEVVKGDRGRELDERRPARDPVAPERRPYVAGADVKMLRLAAEHRRDERARGRCRGDPGRIELRRRPSDASPEAVPGRVVGRRDAGKQDQDAGDDEKAAHPPDDACGSGWPGTLRSRGRQSSYADTARSVTAGTICSLNSNSVSIERRTGQAAATFSRRSSC